MSATMIDPSKVPDFDDLPKVQDLPQGCTWGIFDKGGKKDIFGTINFLTPEVVKEAAKEITTGHHVSLNWPIGAIATPGFGRKGLVHKVIDFNAPGSPLAAHGYDDEIEFNTQCSSQWDSLMHFHHQPSKSGYNGNRTSAEELHQPFGKFDKERKLPTLNHWHDRGGMVARGVLIDFAKYAQDTGRKFNCFDADTISIEDIETIAKKQGVEFRNGDVLIIRCGFTEQLSAMNADEQGKAMASHRVCGVDGTVDVAKWIWNHRFSAVAGDAIAFEQIPPIVDGKEAGVDGLVLHQYLIGLMGMSIGELWDLKALSEHCAKTGRYSFMLTSVPLNVPGAIGSPPNAIAIF